MKKVSNILLTVGGVFHIINGIVFFISSLYFLIAAIAFFAFGYNWMGIQYDEAMAEETIAITYKIVASVYILVGFMFIGCGILSEIAAKITFSTRENGNKKNYITIIVLSAITRWEMARCARPSTTNFASCLQPASKPTAKFLTKRQNPAVYKPCWE